MRCFHSVTGFALLTLHGCFGTHTAPSDTNLADGSAPPRAVNGVGEACNSYVPPGGFLDNEVYLTVRAPDCTTGTCLAYHLSGHPNHDGSCVPMPDHACATPLETEQRQFCTCRCSAPPGQPVCACPSGFTCDAILFSVGRDDVRGGYCVRTQLVDD